MSKTFNSADDGARQLTVDRLVGDPRLLISDAAGCRVGFRMAPSDAPALCLAILEAAKVPMQGDFNNPIEGTSVHLSFIAQHLERYVVEAEERAAADADRVKLEQEALRLYNAAVTIGDPWEASKTSFDQIPEHRHEKWLAVARAARELNKETGQ